METITKLIVTDAFGNIIREIIAHGKRFRFQLLYADQNKLGNMSIEDPWLKVLDNKKENTNFEKEIHINDSIHYALNDWKILPQGYLKLDKIIDIMKNNSRISIEINSHTDSQGSDEYNLQLSEKRARSAVEYIVSKGVDATRISGKGLGETKIINHCTNGISCTEEEHAQNRRTEFKISTK